MLDQFGAADVLVPYARLERQFPGGPLMGTFSARYGPDNRILQTFVLDAPNEEGVPKMLNEALVRIDLIYRDALARGLLKPDAGLSAEQQAFDSALAALRAALLSDSPRQSQDGSDAATPSAPQASAAPSQAAAAVATITVQFDSPDAAAVDAALSAVRGVSGVQSAATTSIAIGGTSVMRVTVSGGSDALAAGLRGRGWQVGGGGSVLSIRR